MPQSFHLEFTIAVHHPIELYVEDNVKQLVELSFGKIREWKILRAVQSPETKPDFKEPTLRVLCKTLLPLPSFFQPLYDVYRMQICKWTKNVMCYAPSTQRPLLGLQQNNAFERVNVPCHEEVDIKEVSFGNLISCSEYRQQACFTGYIVGQFYHDTKLFEIYFNNYRDSISVKYTNIRQIIIHDDKSCTNMFIHMLCPPLHSVTELAAPPPALLFLAGRYKTTFRTVAIPGITPGQIGKSNVMKISFPKSSPAQEIIAKMFFRCGRVPILYTYVDVNAASTSEIVPNFDLLHFNCTYMLTALLRRSFIIQLQHPGYQFNSLVAYLTQLAQKRSHLLYLTLVDMMNLIDDFAFVEFQTSVKAIFDWYEANEGSLASKDSHYIIPAKSRNIWRITLTPTRQLLWPAELMFENRILRKYDAEYACRVAFRDDDSNKLSFNAAYLKENIYDSAIISPMISGITIGPHHFEFLGWSNSQIRDHGVWMYARDQEGNTAASIRRNMGDFSAIRSVSVFMARMGQCYSKSEEAVTITLSEKNVRKERDITGGRNPEDGNKPYCFSDGVGKISGELMKQVHSTMGLETEFSAIQIRYGGCKGMLVLDPIMPENVDIIFRDSMEKFSCRDTILEIVKHSTPVPIFLNRQLITILGQLSIPTGIFLNLQEDMLRKLTDMLLEKDAAVEYLTAHCPLVGMDYADLVSSGFELTSEPFFRSMLLGLHKKAVDGIKTKARLEIGHDVGRNAFGVLDETGSLEYGQVFFKYSVNISKPNFQTKVLTGQVLVTKNPCLQLGDARMLDAVDVPALHHIVDCIVFPQKGPRPHPNEMAGSDLDGDEYTVIWYQPLFFQWNRPASHFPVPTKTLITGPITVPQMVNFLSHYIRNDQVGSLGNAHLVQADRLTLDNPICHRLARKFSIAVDFAKHGQMTALTDEERPQEYPDFMEKRHMETYRNKNALGVLYRVCKIFEDESQPYSLELQSIKVDTELEYPGWERYKHQAEQALVRYNHWLERVLIMYGGLIETEVMAKAVLSIQRRLKERHDKIDAEEMAVKAIQSLWKNMKKEFMEEFVDELDLQPIGTTTSVPEVSKSMLQKASAWYMVTYSNPKPKYISFPWIMSKKLALIKVHNRALHGTPSPTPSTSVITLERILRDGLKVNKVNALTLDISSLLLNNSGLMRGDTLLLSVRLLIHWAKHQELLRDRPNNKAKRIGINDLVRSFLKIIDDLPPDAPVILMLITFFRKCISLRFLDRPVVVKSYPLMANSYSLVGKKSMYTYHSIAISGNLMALGLNPEGHPVDEDDQDMEPVKLPKRIVNAYRGENFNSFKDKLVTLSKAKIVNVRKITKYRFLLSASGTSAALKIIQEIVDKGYKFP